jgi:2-iminobutanoate/2-iminopropanoate deaminase
MTTKTPVHSEKLPTKMFSRGLKVSNYSELFLVSGYGDLGPGYQVRHLGDPVAQTRHIFADVKSFLEQAGYSINDVIRVELTFTKDVERTKYDDIFELVTEFFADVEVKPATGTLRIVDELAMPGMLVEYEFLAAK